MTGMIDVYGSADAPPVVLLHGATMNRNMWSAYDSPRYRAIVPDLPGHGSLIDGRFRLEDGAAAVSRVIDEHADGRAIVVGTSLGGYVGISLAADQPDKVAGLVLSGATASYLGWGGFQTRMFGWLLRMIGGLVQSKNETALRKRLGDSAAPIIDAGISMRAGSDALRDLPGNDFHAMLASYSGPVLILNGERDKVNRKEEDAVVSLLADVRAEMVDDAGHLCVLTQPEAFRWSLERFVVEVSGLAPTT
jgi:pimeloyl-ACP methyl ester carboxylesterase